mmetsp:Transcript_74062/g.209115  ORF Transcript_74062/g.209115 Transcript_74062/m.209115 type:complete len:617 (+) Transcript_74062:54-1904(+)
MLLTPLQWVLILETARRSGSALLCPKGWQKVGDHCYWLSSSQHTFESCQRDVCGPAGATLATMRRQEFGNVLFALDVGPYQEAVAWIGYFRTGRNKSWTWINGWPSKWTYWNWGNPNNYCGGENCAVITSMGGTWLDISCRMQLPCLCEYPNRVSSVYNLSVPAIRGDTCYADCDDTTKWCSAWPFVRLHDVSRDVCRWENHDDSSPVPRGRGVAKCAARVANRTACSAYFSYSVGRCRCSPKVGVHANCSYREVNAGSDVFRITAQGTQLVYPGQRCVRAIDIDADFFTSLSPVMNWGRALVQWWRAASMWLIVGVPCILVMLYATCQMYCCGCAALPDGESPALWFKTQFQSTRDMAYGPIIEAGEADAGVYVNRWVFWAAVGAIIYGVALLLLGVTLTAHMASTEGGAYSSEILESLAMAGSKLVVARAAFMVHSSLAPQTRQVADSWIFVVACAKLGLAIPALCAAFLFITMDDQDYENTCFAWYLFHWSLMLTLPLQCIAGVALWRVRTRAQHCGDSKANVGRWSKLLVVGNFGSGAGVWLGGYMNSVHEMGYMCALFFVLAAVSQLVAGVSLLMVNHRIKEYCREQVKVDEQSRVDAAKIGHGVEEQPST